MKITQLSLFMENKPGQLLAPCEVLGKAGINILIAALADTEKFGILRIVVADWKKAKDALEAAGKVVNVTEVVAVRVASKPGGLAAVLRALEESRINVEYMYAFSGQHGKAGVLIFRFSDNDAALKALQGQKMEILDTETLEKLIED